MSATREELELTEVKPYKDPSFPRWKQDAARWGCEWVLEKVFPAAKGRIGLTLVRWFDGPPTLRMKGCVHADHPDFIWLSVKLGRQEDWKENWKEIVVVSAHEQCHHAGGYYDREDIPTAVGRVAGKAWSGERTVFVHHGPVHPGWLPKGLEELPGNAMCLEVDAGVDTYVNFGRARAPLWRRAVIP